jgi:hypothetical protein
MSIPRAWAELSDALAFAVARIEDDPDPLTEREAADGHQYVMRILAAVAESSLLTFDPAHPAFVSMRESVRYLGASGPDIDYDVALVAPDGRYRVTGVRGGATFVGVCVYRHAGDAGATEIVASVDIDEIVAPDGTFAYEFADPGAARVIVRQYFHDRAAQARGSWSIERVSGTAEARGLPERPLPTLDAMRARIGNAAQSIRWNAQLNQLWTPQLRAHPNRFVRQTSDDIVAAVSNPDVMYATTWWRLAAGEALAVDFTPPDTRYWALQLCDRWFQCFPDRRTNLNDHQVTREPDGSVRIVVADGDPGTANWLDTSGHRTGVMFFRWLHADPDTLPTCTVIERPVLAG